jgi:hypothetical protein
MVRGLKKTGRLKLPYFLQSAEADFVFVGAVSTAVCIFSFCRRGFNRRLHPQKTAININPKNQKI